MEQDVLENRVLKRFIAVQVIVAVAAISVTIIAGRQITTLVRTRSDLALQIESLNHQIADQESVIKKLQAERSKAEAERAAMVQQLMKSRYAADHARAGINHYQRGEYKPAIEEYLKALGITPDNAQIYDWLAYAQYRSGLYLEALQNEQQSVRLDPTYARGYYNMALILWRIGRKRDAVVAVHRMADLNPAMVGEVRKDIQFEPFMSVPDFQRLIGSPVW